MHEVGIAHSILEAVRTEMRPYSMARPVKLMNIALSQREPHLLAFRSSASQT